MISSAHVLFHVTFLSTLLFAGVVPSHAAAGRTTQRFSIPAGDALATLKLFTEQSTEQVVYPPHLVRGVMTHAVNGQFSPRAALDQMVKGTALSVLYDEKTGALAIKRTTDPNAGRAARTETARDRPTQNKTTSPPPGSTDPLYMSSRPPETPAKRLFGAFAALFLAAAPLGGQETAPGALTGRVANRATGAFLEGAEIRVPGTHFAAVTDRDGTFALSLPAGHYTVSVKYTGLEAEDVIVDIAPQAKTVRNFELTAEVYRLEAFTVSGDREGSALAITRQRLADSTRNVVAYDSFGNVASGNVAEILQQIPGVAAIWDGADIRTVQIRGIDPSLNTVTVNGDQMAQSQSAGLGRQFEFDTTSVSAFEMLEVSKVPTPDMSADSIGGAINLVSKSAFDRKAGRLFTYSIGGVYRTKYRAPTSNRWRQPIDGVGPALNFSYSDVFGAHKNIGVILTASAYGQPGGDTATFVNREEVVKDPLYIWRLRLPRPNLSDIFRTSYSAKVDYKLSPATTLSLSSSYTWYYRLSDVRTIDLNAQRTIATLDANGNRIGTGVIDPRYTNTFTRLYRSTANSSTLTAGASDQVAMSYQLQPLVTHKFPSLVIEYGGSYSSSVTYFDASEENRHYNSRPKGTVSTRLTNIGWDVDASKSAGWPSFTQTEGADIYDLNNYSTLTLTQPDRGGTDRFVTGKFNAKKSFDFRLPIELKVGANFREQRRRIWNHQKVYTFLGADGIPGNAEDNLGQFLDREGRLDADYFMGYRPAPYPSPYAAARHRIDHPEQWSLNSASAASAMINNRRSLTEAVTAAYATGTVRLRDLTILSGVRIEQTKVKGSGPLTATGKPTRIVEKEGDYDNVFPGVHLKYAPGRNWVARASYSTSIGRPALSNIIPSESVNEGAMTISGTNPNLRPQTSENYDAGIEYYFEPVGMISASVFQKNIKDFIYTDNSQVVEAGPDNGYGGLYEGYRLTTSNNGGKGRYRGIELAYQQQFRFLPGFWSGFGVNLSYTYLETKGDYGGAVQTDKLAGFVPEYVSGSLSYNRRRVNVRLNGIWRSTYFANVNANPALLQYQREKFTLSLKTVFNWRPGLSFFCDIDNLNASPVADFYYYRPSNENYIRPGTPKIVTGIQGRF